MSKQEDKYPQKEQLKLTFNKEMKHVTWLLLTDEEFEKEKKDPNTMTFDGSKIWI